VTIPVTGRYSSVDYRLMQPVGLGPACWTEGKTESSQCGGGSFLWAQATLYTVAKFRIIEAAELLGVSDDTVRRWIDCGRLPAEHGPQSRRMVIDGATLAAFAQSQAHPARDISQVGRSARNRFVGLITNVITDTVMTQIEIQCGPHRVVSLMTTEAARELDLQPGSLAVAVVKSTQVLIETPSNPLLSTPDDP
jgi:molybdopterin-binding protein